ncbi:hypothetical protein DICA3_F11958 [Diutina catenulata]
MHLIRGPAFYEPHFTLRSQLRGYSNFNVTVQLDQSVTPTHLSHALHHLVATHPNLALITGAEGMVYLLDEIRFNDVASFVQRDFDEAALASLNDIRFDVGHYTPKEKSDRPRPWWTVVVSQSPTASTQWISCVFEHSFVDGMAGANFVADLVESLASVHESGKKPLEFLDLVYTAGGEKHTAHLVREVYGPTPAVCDLYRSPGWWWSWTRLVYELLPSVFKKLYIKWSTGLDLFKHPKFTSRPIRVADHVNYRILHVDIARKLRELRSASLTFTPYFTAVALRAFQEVVVPHFHRRPTSVEAALVVNGRRFYPGIAATALRYNCCMAAIDVLLGPESHPMATLHNDTIAIADQLSSSLQSRVCFHYVTLFRLVRPLSLFKAKVGSHDRASLEVSNLGVHDVSSGKFHADNLWFSQDIGFSCHVGFSVVSSPRGGTNIVMSYLDEFAPVIDAYAARIVSLM